MSPLAPHTNIQALNSQLANQSAGERVATLFDTFGSRAVVSTSFGLQASVMLKLVSEHAPKMPVIFVDTGYNFPETYRYIDTLTSLLDLNLKYYTPLYTPAQQEARWGKRWEQGLEGRQLYAKINKVEPMSRALKERNADVWLSGIRRSQSSTRAHRNFAEAQSDTLKVYPILDWPNAQVEHYMKKHNLPPHPLASKGYVTMGDWHSTRPVKSGESAESTRFGGEKYECGLHIDSKESDFQI